MLFALSNRIFQRNGCAQGPILGDVAVLTGNYLFSWRTDFRPLSSTCRTSSASSSFTLCYLDPIQTHTRIHRRISLKATIMADVWISRKRWTCKYCDVTINDDLPSRRHHESGVRHKQNVKNALQELYRKGEQERKDAEETRKEMARIEALAAESYAKIRLEINHQTQRRAPPSHHPQRHQRLPIRSPHRAGKHKRVAARFVKLRSPQLRLGNGNKSRWLNLCRKHHLLSHQRLRIVIVRDPSE